MKLRRIKNMTEVEKVLLKLKDEINSEIDMMAKEIEKVEMKIDSEPYDSGLVVKLHFYISRKMALIDVFFKIDDYLKECKKPTATAIAVGK